jgi:hypothetical protein
MLGAAVLMLPFQDQSEWQIEWQNRACESLSGLASAGSEADQPGRPGPPGLRGLSSGQGQVAVDFRAAAGGLGALAGQRRIGGIQVRHHLPGDEPQVGAQRPPPATGPARAR